MKTSTENNVGEPAFFFIIGRPRSGTTLLASILDAHPNIIIPFECPLILTLYPKYAKKKNWTQKTISGFIDDLKKIRKFSYWKIDLEKVRTALLAVIDTLDFLSAIKILYSHYQSINPKTEIAVLGDKNPLYSLFATEIAGIFPQAKIIHLTRDFRDQITSMKKMNFELPNTSLQAFRWKYSVKQMFQLKQFSPGRFLTLKYEDLVADPAGKIKEICTFLDIQYHSSMLEYYQNKEKIESVYGKENINLYHSKLFKPVSADFTNTWHTLLTQRQVNVAELVAGKLAIKSGYPLSVKHFVWTDYIVALPGLIYACLWITHKILMKGLPHYFALFLQNTGMALPNIYYRLTRKKT